jgi:hypothetical protein
MILLSVSNMMRGTHAAPPSIHHKRMMPPIATKFAPRSWLGAYEISAALAALLLMLVMLLVGADSDLTASGTRVRVLALVAGSGPALLFCPDLSAPFLPNPAQRHGAVLADQIHRDALFGGAGTRGICPRY